MTPETWTGVIARLTRAEAVDIDAMVSPLDRRAREPAPLLAPPGLEPLPFDPVFRRSDTVVVGVRVREPHPDPARLASRLATYALEQGAGIVVLSHLDYSGLERFGFRAERICGDTPEERAACEAQIERFWGLVVIIEAASI